MESYYLVAQGCWKYSPKARPAPREKELWDQSSPAQPGPTQPSPVQPSLSIGFFSPEAFYLVEKAQGPRALGSPRALGWGGSGAGAGALGPWDRG